MKVQFCVLISTLILMLGSEITTAQTDDVCLSLRQSGPEPEVIQGRPENKEWPAVKVRLDLEEPRDHKAVARAICRK